jgi:hypothetical protein
METTHGTQNDSLQFRELPLVIALLTLGIFAYKVIFDLITRFAEAMANFNFWFGM